MRQKKATQSSAGPMSASHVPSTYPITQSSDDQSSASPDDLPPTFPQIYPITQLPLTQSSADPITRFFSKRRRSHQSSFIISFFTLSTRFEGPYAALRI